MREFLDSLWYGRHPLRFLLSPFSWLYCAVANARRFAYRSRLATVRRIDRPVIVVGNVTVGGTGKTPLVIWLAAFLNGVGYRPALVCRGYGGRAGRWPQQVRPDSDPVVVGDEAVLLAKRTGCPVAAGPDRAAAAQALVAHTDCNLIISDDGLQHYGLGRDIEIAVVDGVRRFGNGYCLPAGPLREPASRLADADLVVSHGLAGRGEFTMNLAPMEPRNVKEDDSSRSIDSFKGAPVHAVCGIGYPERFFSQLRRLGLDIVRHPFADHHPFAPSDIEFDDSLPILMTEKDAVKCRWFAGSRHWYLPVSADPHPAFGARLLTLLRNRANGQETP